MVVLLLSLRPACHHCQLRVVESEGLEFHRVCAIGLLGRIRGGRSPSPTTSMVFVVVGAFCTRLGLHLREGHTQLIQHVGTGLPARIFSTPTCTPGPPAADAAAALLPPPNSLGQSDDNSAAESAHPQPRLRARDAVLGGRAATLPRRVSLESTAGWLQEHSYLRLAKRMAQEPRGLLLAPWKAAILGITLNFRKPELSMAAHLPLR